MSQIYSNEKDGKFVSSLEFEDYLIASACGLLAGAIDVVFVGDPSNSILKTPVDNLADRFVISTAHFFRNHDRRFIGKKTELPNDITSCIRYLEQAFPVRYDATRAGQLKVTGDVLSEMNTKNHHLYSLSHSPDIVGLFFAIIDQFNPQGKASFWNNGQVIHVVTSKPSNELPYFYGKDNTAKFFCGFINWIGHLVSDFAGSNGSKGRGMGLPMPFYNLALAAQGHNEILSGFADTMIKVYEQGYDLRFGIATAIPVVINDLLIRCVWTLRNRFIRGLSWEDSLPKKNNDDFRMMLLIGNLSFTLVDVGDAAINGVKNGAGSFNYVSFGSRLNYVGLTRFAGLAIREGLIRSGRFTENEVEALQEKLLGAIPEDRANQFIAIHKSIHLYLDSVNYTHTIKVSLDEYVEARKRRIQIESESGKNSLEIKKLRSELYSLTESYFSDCYVAFDSGIELMDLGIAENDSNQFIEGNNIIQKKLGGNPQFDNQDEFDRLISSDDDFVF